ncbi:MAG: NADH-quinone oxidoreductase subunit L [Fibrobacter sp.]|nr:NADH-quinone oxidoreductase subunit L [Fibrobacter sp.]
MTNLPLWFIPLFPLIGTILLGTIAVISSGSKKGPSEGFVGALAVLFPALAFASVVLLAFGMPETGIRQTLCNWIDVPMLKVDIGFLFDGLSRIMLLFVTGIGSLIALYSIGYMHGDRGFARFFAYINLFLFSMIVLVLSDSLLLTFLGWEGVGLCSYLLIGFWNHDVNNCKAANKAFIVNRVGDIGFLLGMLVLCTIGGSAILNYDQLAAFIQMVVSGGHVEIVIPFLSLAGICFFVGCTGKSAQIPLLTWLPDAMAGPTPVSALIHAATMVTSGVYLLARLGSMFAMLPTVLDIITVVGMLTAFWAAVAGLFQNDIKKVLAYSTISQLGYMFMAAGVAAFDASIFHVFTHAFFKAALFLGAGAVIHALAGEQDMRKMGGLVKKVPVTACVMIFAFLAIIGIPGFAGFWSKDLILERLYMSGPMGPYYYAVGLLTAVITAVYMGRLIILTFFGSYRGSKESEHHIHEAPACMLIPMVILAVGAVFSGYMWADSIGLTFFRDMLAPVVGAAQLSVAHSEAHVNPMVFAGLGTAAAVLGLVIAWARFGKARIPEAKGSSAPTGKMATWTFLFDIIHGWFICLTNVVAWIIENCVDKLVQFVQWLVAGIVEILGDGVASFQVRKVRLQLALSVAGVVALVLVVLLTGGMI